MNFENKDIYPRQHFDRMQIAYLKTLVCDEVIEEYRKQPLGQHSEPLQRLLNHFWSLPLNMKYGIKRTGRPAAYQIIKFSGIRGVKPDLIEETAYETVEEVYHAIFLKHINTLKES